MTARRASIGRLLKRLPLLVWSSFALAAPASAQDWTPTVATAPGGTLHDHNRAPTQIDPRFFPAPRDPAPVVRAPLPPPEAWSPLVTGALPKSAAPAKQADTAPRVAPEAVAAQPDLSPVRPTTPHTVVAAGADAPGTAAPAEGAGAGEPLFKKPGPLDALPPNASAAQQYCFNTADTAADARFAWQARKIREMEAALDKKARQLEAKTEDYKRWLARRDDFARKAHEKLVGFYSRMRPDAAAVQLATLDEEMAAAVVMKLETKVASQIMGEMDPERAAKIATIISGAGKVPRDRRRAAAQADADGGDGAPGEVAGSPGEGAAAEGSGS